MYIPNPDLDDRTPAWTCRFLLHPKGCWPLLTMPDTFVARGSCVAGMYLTLGDAHLDPGTLTSAGKLTENPVNTESRGHRATARPKMPAQWRRRVRETRIDRRSIRVERTPPAPQAGIESALTAKRSKPDSAGAVVTVVAVRLGLRFRNHPRWRCMPIYTCVYQCLTAIVMYVYRSREVFFHP